MLDSVRITLQAWKWGDGAVSARKEAHVAYGWPAWGDGGRGGDIIFRASKDKSTLIDFRHRSSISAKAGENGMTKDQYGASALPITVEVPIGTIVKDVTTWQIVVQFVHDGQEVLLARGGKGWAGNIHFKNSIRQYPNFALYGEPGQVREIELELQMLGDVGLIGTPSVGKSSLINSLSNTKVKTADYHFTTLKPSLGIVKVEDTSFSLVDIPGLIEGAAEGKWLGSEFLRHVLKAKIFALVTDADSFEAWFNKLTTVIDEITSYIRKRFVGSKDFGEEISAVDIEIEQGEKNIFLTGIAHRWSSKEVLFKKLLHIVINKSDTIDDEEILEELKKWLVTHLTKYFEEKFQQSVSEKMLFDNTFVVSALTRSGLQGWKYSLSDAVRHPEIVSEFLFDTVAETEAKEVKRITDITVDELPLLLEYGYLNSSSENTRKVREIRDPELSRLVTILPRGNDQAEYRFWKVFTKQNYHIVLRKNGVSHNDILKIKSYYEEIEDKYIVYV